MPQADKGSFQITQTAPPEVKANFINLPLEASQGTGFLGYLLLEMHRTCESHEGTQEVDGKDRMHCKGCSEFY